ncbi:MAG: TerB family tellurite resistance protein [Paracoccaceae bacterium]
MTGIFRKISALFEAPEAAASDHDPAALGLAALMVRLARADGAFDGAERAAIQAALDARFGNGAALLAAGEVAEADASDSHQFTRLVKAASAPEDRAALLEDLWSVVLADGARDDDENALMRQFGALLYVSDQDMARARHRAERR